jgi:predicted nucleic acid-binding protein
MDHEDIFVDTGAWVALADEDDTHHGNAIAIYPTLLKSSRSLITTNLVIAESYVIIMNELGHRAVVRFLEGVNASPRIVKVYSNENIERESEDLLRRYDDQDFSYSDSVSFTIMKRQKIKKAFSFDKHFQTMGFVRIP